VKKIKGHEVPAIDKRLNYQAVLQLFKKKHFLNTHFI